MGVIQYKTNEFPLTPLDILPIKDKDNMIIVNELVPQGAVFGNGCKFFYCFLGDGIKVGDNAEISEHIRIGNNFIAGNILQIGNNVQIGSGLRTGMNSIIGNKVLIGVKSRIGAWSNFGYDVKIGESSEIGAFSQFYRTFETGKNTIFNRGCIVRKITEKGEEKIPLKEYLKSRGDNLEMYVFKD
jgi:NDP-sugar pyrophosphorylase family protein